MICNSYGIDDMHGYAVILRLSLNPNICEEESAFALGEVSRLCIPPVAVYCQARRAKPHYSPKRNNHRRLRPERQTLYTKVAYLICNGYAVDDIQCSALMICNSFGIDDIHGYAVILRLRSNP